MLGEIAGGTLTRVEPDGGKEVIAHLGGGPNGAAIGPDGYCYVCNSGGFDWQEEDGVLFSPAQARHYTTGRIERVNLETGAAEVLYDSCGGHPLKAPNDIVFDAEGGFWFTDFGQTRRRDKDHGGVYYARPDGLAITEAIYPVETPNGVGLSPDEKTLYVAESITGRILAFDVPAPGELTLAPQWPHGRLLATLDGLKSPDSLALQADGTICVANYTEGGITSVSADDGSMMHIPLPDPQPTNICFGGKSLGTAYITLSGTGSLVAMDWPRPGLALNFLNR